MWKIVTCWALILPICAAPSTANDAWDRDIVELIYQAEVFGQREEAVNAFRETLLKESNPDRIDDLVRAMAVVKQSEVQFQFPALLASLAEAGRAPESFINVGAMAYLGTGDFWVELGDWAGERFIRRIEPGRIVLESIEGDRIEHLLMAPAMEMATSSRGRCVLIGADASFVLRFIASKAGLNFFIPSSLNRKLNGVYGFPDWLALMDALCRDGGIMWTRRSQSVIFSMNYGAAGAEILPGVEVRGENLGNFLEQLAEAFGMDLIMDDELAGIGVDIKLGDQPWDEVLDCLSIMNGFTWNQLRDPAGRARLVIQKE